VTKDEEIEALKAEIEALKSQLRRCFKGDVISVRNELVIEALHRETERVLAMPEEDIRDYLSRKFDN
jgi:hypothetical protein